MLLFDIGVLTLVVACAQVEPLEAADNSDDELQTALQGVRQREKAKTKKMKKKEMKKAQRLRGIIASGTNHGTCRLLLQLFRTSN